ncbi:synaptotagmin-16-like [Pollicipes pollicipes]|uniref:synaptotagmin-16-like n=1 Tax=Pollicipes pollicipes TaxID=41117 RepID=UPI0018852E65|nr:synaptotagmin-16-like [Pollicipes pollicipes]
MIAHEFPERVVLRADDETPSSGDSPATPACRPPATNGELSAAERGKMGEGTSSSCSSTTSGEDELGSSLRRRDCRRYRQLAARARSLDDSPPAREPGVSEEPALPDEHLFDFGDVSADASLSRCGSLEVACAYDSPSRKLSIQVLQAKGVPSRDRGGASNTQVRLVLLPGKKQRLRSRMQPGEAPQFNEAFVFNKVDPDDLPSMGVRLRLYGCERLRRERMIGEAVLPFSGANVEQQTPMWITLQPRANMTLTAGGTTGDTTSLCRSDSTSSTQSIHHGGVPELLLGLQYNATTGRLAVEVIKGSHFRATSGSRAPDTYVRLHLLSSSGRELARSRTSVRRGQPNPLYKETFMFQIPLFQLCDVTLMVSIYSKRNMTKRDLIGWFGLGHNSSGNEERSHWSDAHDARGVQICRWHLLCEE